MACKPYTVAQFDAQDPTHISVHSRRVLARLDVHHAYLRALEQDPSLALDHAFISAARDNSEQLFGEVFI